MTSENGEHVSRDRLVEHAAPMVARALLASEDPEGLWAYVRERVESERDRIETDTIRDALEPLQERFPMDVVARVAATMADESAAKRPGETSSA